MRGQKFVLPILYISPLKKEEWLSFAEILSDVGLLGAKLILFISLGISIV